MKQLLLSLSPCLCLTLQAIADSSQTSPPPAYQPEGVTTQPKGIITPPVAPRVNNGTDFVIDADFIWWKSRVTNMNFAILDHRTVGPAFSFEPGFKVGIGLDLIHDGWDTYANYTYLYQPWLDKTTAGSGHLTYIVATTPSLTSGLLTMQAPSLTEVASSRKSQFNILDLEAGRNFFISKRLTLRPHFGLKLAWMFEKNNITGTGTNQNTAHLDFKQNLFGVGIRTGLDTVWHLTRTFGFYGDMAVTALWSNFHDSLVSTLTGTAIKNRNNSQDIIPVLEAGLGLTYMTWFSNESYQFYAKAGWEEQIWLDYNHNNITAQDNNTGNLSLQGLTVKAGFAF